MAIKYNGIEFPSYVKVNSIVNSILPSVSQSTKKVNNKAGLIDYGTEIGTRNIQVSITILASNIEDLRAKVRDFAEILYYEEAKKLVILEEPNIFYMAKFNGDSQLNEILSVGQSTINFICHDPFAYNMVERNYQFMPTEATPYGFENNGTHTCYPRLEFEFTDNAYEFSIVGNDEYLYFGNPIQIDLQTPVEANPLVLAEPFISMTGWTTGIGLTDGIITGGAEKFISNGYSIKVNEFGEGAGWHGASSIKSLPYQLDQFKFKFRIGLHSNKIETLGRIQLYGLDQNGQRLFVLEFRDGNVNAMSPYATWQIKNQTIMQTYGGNIGTGKRGGGVLNYWNGFVDGFYDIARRKNKEGQYVWQVWIARYESKTKTTHHSLLHQWVDKNNEYSDKLASVQIHIGAYGDVEPTEQMYIQDLKVYDEDPIPNDDEVPFIFHAGDVLVVNSEDGSIWLNGEEFYHYLDPASRFITFREKGINGIWVSPLVVTNGKVSYRERWL